MVQTMTAQEVATYLHDNPDLLPIAQAALAYFREWEAKPKVFEWDRTYIGFQWHQLEGVIATHHELKRLYAAGVLGIASRSNKSTYYTVVDPAKLEEAIRMLQEGSERDDGIPPDLFDVIVGYESAKELFRRAITAEKPVHLLLLGPPATAKTLFLMEVGRLPRGEYHLGSSSTKAGLSTRLIEHKPRFLLIDELEKMATEDQDVLLSVCETGLVKETKYGRWREVQLDTRVFAGANTITNVRTEVISRFQRLKFDPYTEEEFMEVVVKVLAQREGMPEKLGAKIARAVWEWSPKEVTPDRRFWNNTPMADPREAIRIARLVRKKTEEEVERVLGLIAEYR